MSPIVDEKEAIEFIKASLNEGRLEEAKGGFTSLLAREKRTAAIAKELLAIERSFEALGIGEFAVSVLELTWPFRASLWINLLQSIALGHWPISSFLRSPSCL